MVVSARDVAAALRERLPGLPLTKEHKLLYYCQGHHLATFGVQLFKESVSAWDMGPVVGEHWHAEREGTARPGSSATLDEAQLNTVGYVVSRYGGMIGNDLIKLTHAEDPWLRANATRRQGERVKIRNEWMRDYFRQNAVDDDDIPLDSEEVTAWLGRAAEERQGRADPMPDSREELVARVRG
jgi:uncharacterized phage-associated protein